MDIIDEVNFTLNNPRKGFEEADYVGMIPTSVTEVIDELTGGDPGSQVKRLKTFVPPGIETISDQVVAKFIPKLQVHLNHSAEFIVGAQESICLLNRKIGEVSKDHTKILCAMVDIMKKLIPHGAVLENIDLDFLAKEAIEAHLLTLNTKTSVDEAMVQAMSEAAKVRYISATLTQRVTLGAGRCLDSMHRALNMGDQNIGVLKKSTGL